MRFTVRDTSSGRYQSITVHAPVKNANMLYKCYELIDEVYCRAMHLLLRRFCTTCIYGSLIIGNFGFAVFRGSRNSAQGIKCFLAMCLSPTRN